MIDVEKIVPNETICYTPQYGGIAKVLILRLFKDGNVLVKQPSKNMDRKPFCRPISFVYNCAKNAENGRRSWESYQKRQKKEEKERRKMKKAQKKKKTIASHVDNV